MRLWDFLPGMYPPSEITDVRFDLCRLARGRADASFWCFLTMQRDGSISTVSTNKNFELSVGSDLD